MADNTMKAIVLDGFGGPEQMRLATVDKPRPAAGEVLIRVAATSVNRPDVVQRQGNYAPPPGESDILGLEVAGHIEAVGAQVSDWQVGQRVFALVAGGGYAEFTVARADHCVAVPESMSLQSAACIAETYLTAWLNIFRLGRFEDGETILLHGGGGGVNTAAIQLCRTLCPQSEIFVTASTGKVERVKALGVTHVIDYREQSFVDEIRRLTGKRGVDVILDHIGAPYLSDNMRSLAPAGRLLLIGVMGGIKAELNLAAMMVKRQQIIGSVLRSRPPTEKALIIAGFDEQVMPAMARGDMAPLVSGVMPLAQAADAHRAMEAGSHFGKIVLSVDDALV